MVSLQDITNARIYLRDVVAVTAPTAGLPTITINTPLPPSGCTPNLTAVVVAPISTLRYMLEDTSADPELARLAGATTLGGGRRLALVRREIAMTSSFATPVPIPGTARVVLDFATSFRIEAVWNSAAPGVLPVLTYAANPDTNAGTPPAASLRSLIIELVADSAERVTGGVVGSEERQSRALAARRVSRIELFLPNMARNQGLP
jgi:hypothetical protein